MKTDKRKTRKIRSPKLPKSLIFNLSILVLFLSFLQPVTAVSSPPAPTPSPSPTISEFSLSISSLDIEAPIIGDVDGANQLVYDRALENGVAHLLGSAKPGENGNIVIFGHSSYYWTKPGEYKFIFKNLYKIQPADIIILHYNGKDYQYKVSAKKIVWPNQVDVLAPTEAEQLNLITCYPPLSTQKRLIISAQKLP